MHYSQAYPFFQKKYNLLIHGYRLFVKNVELYAIDFVSFIIIITDSAQISIFDSRNFINYVELSF